MFVLKKFWMKWELSFQYVIANLFSNNTLEPLFKFVQYTEYKGEDTNNTFMPGDLLDKCLDPTYFWK